ncbi:MAG: extracellular solute-binding protein [Hyphomicrobiales bacterium]|nr:extracellular solute-binding protein [Hyphomicrobiales bacterium]
MGTLRMGRAGRCLGVLLLLGAAAPMADAAEKRHGLSIFGELKYPTDFSHFEYVNPSAPKGGRIVLQGEGARTTFNSFNGYILKGDYAQGLNVLFDTLMARALDEPDAVYGLAAHSAEVADDGRSVIFYLRPEARFADGSPLTAEDVAFSVMTLKEKGHPLIALTIRNIAEATAVDPHTVKIAFGPEDARDLPVIVSQLPIFSKAYYAKRPFDESTLEPPLGSGPYAIGEFKQGSFVVFKRRADYWAADLPVNRGKYNFDEIRYDYYRDRTAEFEALKGGAYDLREEFTSKTWATEYDIPQVKSGRIVRAELPDGRPGGAQGWLLNTRRPKLADRRVREALGYAFDFEWTNKRLFYGLYKRTESYFENSDLKADGPPSPAELALLEPHRDKLPAEVFGEAYKPPVTDGSGDNRENRRKASKLLEEAGWTLKTVEEDDPNCGFFCGVARAVGLSSAPTRVIRVNAQGEPLTLEFLIDDPIFERVLGPFVENLKLIGVDARLRRVDAAQYEERKKSFDYDVVSSRFVLPATPGVQMLAFWSSQSADARGSFNLAGIKDPVVDALMQNMLAARNRDELRVAAGALDRVLRAGHYWVPNWYKSVHHIAYWDKFSRPPVKPPYSRAVIETWWYDAEKAAKLAQ